MPRRIGTPAPRGVSAAARACSRFLRQRTGSTIAKVNPRARWTLVGLGIAILASILVPMIVDDAREPRTWVVHPGETLTFSADEVHPHDLYRCPGKGGVNGTPEPGHGVGGSGGFSVETAGDGTVTAYCEPGPPGNV